MLLDRFQACGGALYDLEYLVGADGRRVAAFGYWAGYAGATVSLLTYVAQQKGALIGSVHTFCGRAHSINHRRIGPCWGGPLRGAGFERDQMGYGQDRVGRAIRASV